MAEQMKGITVCGDCVYYSMKKHRCTRGCTEDNDYNYCPHCGADMRYQKKENE